MEAGSPAGQPTHGGRSIAESGRPAFQKQQRWTGEWASAPTPATNTLHLRCAEPCWLDERAMHSGRQMAYRMLKGEISLPVGAGLDVFSAWADLLKVRLSNGVEQPFSTHDGRPASLPVSGGLNLFTADRVNKAPSQQAR
jgi:hypothetical protein